MEAIGQKTVIPVNDEAIAVTEFGIESEDVGENKVFDATLKQELAEIPLDEELLEELLDEDALSSSLNSVILTQNQQNPENAENEFYIAQKSNIPLEILEDNHLNKNVSSLQVQVLKKKNNYQLTIFLYLTDSLQSFVHYQKQKYYYNNLLLNNYSWAQSLKKRVS